MEQEQWTQTDSPSTDSTGCLLPVQERIPMGKSSTHEWLCSWQPGSLVDSLASSKYQDWPW